MSLRRSVASDITRATHVELQKMADSAGAERLLATMGREIANVHHGSPRALPAVRRDLARRGPRWLAALAQSIAEATHDDARAWVASGRAARRARHG